MRISDWSSDGCSSDLAQLAARVLVGHRFAGHRVQLVGDAVPAGDRLAAFVALDVPAVVGEHRVLAADVLEILQHRLGRHGAAAGAEVPLQVARLEEHTSELQSLMRISYAVFCLKKKRKTHHNKKL